MASTRRKSIRRYAPGGIFCANGKDKHKDHDQHAQAYGHPVQGGYAHGGEHDKHKKDKKDKKHKDKDKKKVYLSREILTPSTRNAVAMVAAVVVVIIAAIAAIKEELRKGDLPYNLGRGQESILVCQDYTFFSRQNL